MKIELSKGLEFKSSWTPPTEFVKSGSQSATWSPGDTDDYRRSTSPREREIDIEPQLTSDSQDDIPMEERCIRAWVEDSIPPPRPDYVFGSLTQCLGDPKVLFEEGDIDLFYLHDCVCPSAISYPCRDTDENDTADNGMELVVYASVLGRIDK